MGFGCAIPITTPSRSGSRSFGSDWVTTRSEPPKEDTVLAQLEWSKASRSDRQVQDVVDLLRVRGSDLDRAYLDHWARELGVVDLLDAAFPTR